MKYTTLWKILSISLLVSSGALFAQTKNINKSRFKQLDEILPTPNTYRTGSGAPGHEYWQQKADYEIEAEINDENQRLTGSEKITYTNNSPDALSYLWVQLDQNMRAKNSDTYKTLTSRVREKYTMNNIQEILDYPDYDGGHKIQGVKDKNGKDLPYTINKTMMRVDLPEALKKGESFELNIKWYYNINDRDLMGGRGGYNLFKKDGNYIYSITQWFPRMAVYDDVNGWQHKQFLGRGEFALPFGDYKVKITVPADHIVASTGTLQNPKDVLTDEQQRLYEKAKTADKPVVIVSQKEAEKKEKKKAKGKKTWVYHAENVRDFAFGSSRKFIWDALGVKLKGKKEPVMAMSYYPKEANPLWGKYSTEVVAHTLRTYSKYTITYPYPVAISVEGNNGMEYPMICFNYGRPNADGTYSKRTRNGMIGVIIHEVGHNFFPMIINSDERQWTWMDEGLNTFVQYLTEQEWERNFDSRRGPAHKIVPYMAGDKRYITPIMTNSESIFQFGNNAYGKPAAALNILRETVMGRTLFDHAFKEYATRWAFKHPKPADFFRTMEDASGVDLDWFWRGWFYTTDHTDIALKGVQMYEIDTQNPDVEKKKDKRLRAKTQIGISQIRNKKAIPKTVTESKSDLRDFYTSYDELDVVPEDQENYKKYMSSIGQKEKKFLKSGIYFYELSLENAGGLVMPVIVKITYTDGTDEVKYFPAEIWRNGDQIKKIIPTKKEVKSFEIDPFLETADINRNNNYYPARSFPSKFEIFKRKRLPRGSTGISNPMQRAKSRKK